MDIAGGGGAGSRSANAPSVSADGARQAQGAGRTILVIDDEPNIIEAIRFILRRDGWSVTTHADGRDAMAQVETLRPQVVILDMMLPGRSGMDILREMRAHPGLAQTPVIVLTAKGQAAERDLATRTGASMFMAKPFGNAELLAAVRQLAGA
jgi:two-component system, OmpR family, response regulator